MAAEVQAQSNGAAVGSAEKEPLADQLKEQPAQEKKDDNWRFIPPQPVREDQVQNAVNFLSHPKVRGSPIVYRRSFLERKGLTKDEIDEAFQRVPDPPPDSRIAQSTQAPAANQSSALAATPQQPAAVPNQQVGLQTSVNPAAIVPRRGARWTQIVLAIGVLTAAGAGAAVVTKKYLFPRLKAWMRHVVLDEDNAEIKKSSSDIEASKAVAATAAAGAAATEVAALARELRNSRTEEHRYFESVIKSMEMQTQELKSLTDALVDLQKSRHVTSAVNDDAGFSSADHYKGSLFQAQAAKDIKLSHGATTNIEQLPNARPSSAPSTAASNNPPHPASYMEVLAMLERGEKPPGIREVNDKPPNASQVPSNPQLQPKIKPWERNDTTRFASTQSSDARQNIDLESVLGASNAEPWWRQKRDDSAKPVENSVRITEIDSTLDHQVNGSGLSNGVQSGSGSSSHTWVPPPAPKIILPGVDAAIRHKVAPKLPYDATQARPAYDAVIEDPEPADLGSASEDKSVHPSGDASEAEIVTKEATTSEEQEAQ